jgi:outer membrane lipoprotein LolB
VSVAAGPRARRRAVATCRAVVGVAAAAWLAGCATVPPGPAMPPPAPSAQAALATFDDWRATGRVAVKTAQDGWSASFDWREADGRGELGVRGPFGAGAARITRTESLVRIESGSAEPVEVAAPFDALEPALVERLGMPLPLAQLRWWILGVPAPGAPSVGAGAAFEQSGWQVRIDEYTAVGGAPAPLPRRLVIERDATRIRVVVDRWALDSP